MNVRKWIAEQKEAHRREKLSRMKAETSRIRLQNVVLEQERKRQLELQKATEEKVRLQKEINASQESLKPKEQSKLQKIGQGLKSVVNKQKEKRKGMKLSAPPSSGSRGLEVGRSSSPFSGERNIEVGGGGSPFNQPGRDIFGTRPAPVEKKESFKPKSKTIIRY